MKSKQTKADVNPVRRTAFNKENAPELLGQLVRVLKSQGMDDALQAIKSCGLTKKLNDEWMDDTSNRKRKRGRRAGQQSLSALSNDFHDIHDAVDMTRKAYKPLSLVFGRLAKPRGSMDDPIFRSGYLEDVDEAIDQIRDIEWAAPTMFLIQSALSDALSELVPLSKKLQRLQSRRDRRASSSRVAAAAVTPVRQRTQFTCMSTSLMMCLQALGHKVTEDEVNDVMGARPKKGAAWENALAAAQHYGCRATLVTPSTVQQLKEWTDAGIPVMIAWNPEGRPWSHASVVFDVDEDLNVYVADPNIPDPDETVRIVPKAEFYSKWSEKWPDYIVRRPAMAVEREITPEGRQVMASTKPRGWKKTLVSWSKEYKTPEGENLGAMTIDRGKVNWRPNQLIEGFVRPQVISRSRSGEEIPSNEKLSLVADAWVKKNYGRRAKTASGSPLMTMPDYGLSMQERWERGLKANDTDSGAGSDEDMFFKAPDRREVLEFALSGAISNSMDVAIDHAKELDIPLLEELADVAVSPPLPTEIAREPGGKALSTLNRYVVKTEDPAAAPAVKINQDRMAFWKAELETR